jgi:hypothetical protein
MTQTGNRRFIGIVRTQGSSTSIPVEAKDESSATKALQSQYGTENYSKSGVSRKANIQNGCLRLKLTFAIR